jgi:phosphate-selective porin
MRSLLPALAVALVTASAAAPALADTLQEVTTKGMVLTLGGTDIEFTFTSDGRFTAANGALSGAWRIDGDKLCTTANVQPEEMCVAYPRGKKSGDTFDLTTEQGTATIHIK